MSGILKSISTRLITSGVQLPEQKFERFYELVHLEHLLKLLRINCLLDVGANRGQYVEDLRALGYKGQIISFEPVKKEFDKLHNRFSSDSNWQGHQIALGGEEKTMTIHVHEESVYSSFLEKLDSQHGLPPQEVQVKRLDDIFPSLIQGIESPRVFLKMDTQGFDLEVFKGAAGCLEHIVGIQSELSIQPIYKGMPHYLEALQVYESAEFELFNLSPVSRTDNGRIIELNCFMRRK